MHNRIAPTYFLLVLLSSMVKAQYREMTRFMESHEAIYRKLFKGPRADVLNLPPYCYSASFTASDYEKLESSNLSAEEYKLAAKKAHDPISIQIGFQILQLVELDEKSQTIKLVMEFDRTWHDCRLTWDSADLSTTLLLETNSLKKLHLFMPGIALLEMINPEDTKDSEIQSYIHQSGDVTVQQQFSTGLACIINVRMYPFDVQTCSLTFESVLPDSHAVIEALLGPDKSVEHNSKNLLGQYTRNEQWTITILPGQYQRRKICDMVDFECTVSGVKHLLLLRRHPDYQLINLLIPAFMIVLISGCVFMVPPGSGDKMGLSVSNLLALYMFSQLMYDKMPETGSTIPLLSQYFLTCIALVSASCVYSAMSSIFTSACPRVPNLISKLVHLLGPILLFDLIKVKKQHPRKAIVQHSENRDPAESNATDEATRLGNEFPGTALRNGRHLMKNFKVTWTLVGALFDRCFFIVHIFISITLLVLFITEGYLHWSNFAGYSDNETVMAYACVQGKLQGDTHGHGCKVKVPA